MLLDELAGSVPDTPDRETFEAAAAASFGQLLFKAARLLDDRALERIRGADDGPPIRPAHTRLLPHITDEGIRATDLAERLEVTKQAVTPLIADLAAWGYVESVRDPSDGRARLIRWTPAGRRGLMQGLGVLAEFEAELASRVGVERVDQARQVLASLLALLEPR